MICFNGKIIREKDFSINFNNRFFLYGDGFFETIKIVRGKPLFWDDHYYRIMGSLCMLRMPIPSYFNSEYLFNNIQSLLNSNKLNTNSTRIRIVFFRNSDGYYLPDNNDFSYVISSEKLKTNFYNINEKGLTVDIFNQYKLGTCELNTLKSTNRIINVLASMYTKDNFLDDSILINEKNNIVESTSGNLFFVSDNQLVTPSLDSGCIDGIIRKKILSFSNFMDLEVKERDVKKSDLFNANELFFTNVISGLKWVSNFKEKKFNNKYSLLILKKLNTLI